jgi:peptidoglycan/LPS O-acetylase OafA/YrhL
MGLFRLFLAAIVMLGHYDVIEVSLSTMAVCCFYAISGFYMQLLLAGPDVSIRNFYISRACRIFPLYWAFTAITFLAQAPSDLWQIADHMLVKAIYLVNTLTLIGHDAVTLVQYNPETRHFSPLLFLGNPAPGNWVGYNLTVLGQAWSLSVELLFYALAPLLLKFRTRWVCGILLGSASIKAYIASLGVYETFWIDAFFPAELMFFLSGALGFRVYKAVFAGNRTFALPSRVVNGIAITACVGATVIWGNDKALIDSHWFAIYFSITILTALMLPWIFNASKSNLADRWLGNLSYPIYLSHLAVVQVMKDHLRIDSLLAIILGTVAVSVIAYCLLEEPVDRFRHRRFPIHRA